MKRVLITSCGSDDGCANYRINEVYRSLHSDKINFIFEPKNELSNKSLEYDAIILQRPCATELPSFIQEYQKLGGKIIVETDDDLTCLPLNNPVYHYYRGKKLEAYKECLRLADYIHTSTPEIHPKGIVFPNAIDFRKYFKKETHEKTVMWAGGVSHYDSLLLIKPVIAELLNKGIRVLMMGDKTWLKNIMSDERIEMKDWVDFKSYHFVPSFAGVFITPLNRNKFTMAKSELKCIEAGAYGVPCVSSMVTPYERFNKVSNGGNILIKKERLKDWMDAILSLLEDENLYRKHSELSYNAVYEHYNLEVVNKKRLDWWESILN